MRNRDFFKPTMHGQQWLSQKFRDSSIVLLSWVFLTPLAALAYAPAPEMLPLTSTAPIIQSTNPEPLVEPRPVIYGVASWYSENDENINLFTANGEVFDDTDFTCASWEYEFNTFLKITNLANGKSVVCRVNDRGPKKALNRAIDLTKSSYKRIAPLQSGLIDVSIEKL